MTSIRRAVKNNRLAYPVLGFSRWLWLSRSHLVSIWKDYNETRRSTTFLREHVTAGNGKRLLIFALDDDHICSLKQYAFIVQALRLKGWQITVLLRHRGMLLGKAYFRCFGITDFVYLNETLLSKDEIEFCRRSCDGFMAEARTLQDVKLWQFNESWIGSQVISTLGRLRFEGQLNFDNPQVRASLETTLLDCLENVLRADKVLKKNTADLGITIEANYSIFGPLVDMAIANGVNVVQMTQPWRDDALTFWRLNKKTRREHPSSVTRETLKAYSKQPWEEREEQQLKSLLERRYSGYWQLQARNQPNVRGYSRDSLLERFCFSPEKPLSVVFSHVLWDANLFYGEDIFEDYGDWFVQTVKAACENPSVNWLVKLHPANAWKRDLAGVTKQYAEITLINEHIGELPPHVKIIMPDDDISTFALFELMDYAVTVRGTSGMEAPCFGKHCVTAGTGRYAHRGFTLDCETPQQYLDRLAMLHTQPPMTAKEVAIAKWHALIAFEYRLFHLKSARSVIRNGELKHPLYQNLEMVAASVDELTAASDLTEWADWAEGSKVEYLDVPEQLQTMNGQ